MYSSESRAVLPPGPTLPLSDRRTEVAMGNGNDTPIVGSQVLGVRGTQSVGVGAKESGAVDSAKEKRKHLRKWNQAESRGNGSRFLSKERGGILSNVSFLRLKIYV